MENTESIKILSLSRGILWFFKHTGIILSPAGFRFKSSYHKGAFMWRMILIIFIIIYYYLLPVMGAGKKRTVVTVTSIER